MSECYLGSRSHFGDIQLSIFVDGGNQICVPFTDASIRSSQSDDYLSTGLTSALLYFYTLMLLLQSRFRACCLPCFDRSCGRRLRFRAKYIKIVVWNENIKTLPGLEYHATLAV